MMRGIFVFNHFFRRKNIPILAWFVWIFIGTIFYCHYDGFPLHVAIYKSTSVGWAIGWALPVERSKSDDSYSLLFSSFHNFIGVIFVGLSIIYIAQEIASSKEDWTVQVTTRQILKDREVHGVCGRPRRWCLLHKAQLRLVGTALGLILLGTAGGYSVGEYSAAEALDMTLSTISTCGYRGLPQDDVSAFVYVMLAVYTNLAVPVFAIALASLISLAVDTPDEKYFYSKIAAPLTDTEITCMQTFGIDDGDGLLDAKEFVVLSIIRVGNVPPRLVLDIIGRFKALTVSEHTAQIPYESIQGYEQQERAPPAPPSGVRKTLLQLSRRFSVAPSAAASSVAGTSSAAVAAGAPPCPSFLPAGLQLIDHRQPPLSAVDAINKRRERRESARQSLAQLRVQGEQQQRITREARAGVDDQGLPLKHAVPFASPFRSSSSKSVVAPDPTDNSVNAFTWSSEHKHEKPLPDERGETHRDERFSLAKHTVVSCSDMMMQEDDDVEEQEEEQDELLDLENSDKEDEHHIAEEQQGQEEEEGDDDAIDEVRRPSEISSGCTTEPSSADREAALRIRTLSMEMDTKSLKEPAGFRYKNSGLVRRRTERRDTFIPSGTYEILSIQNRRKSAAKLRRKRSVSRAAQRPSVLAQSVRRATVQRLKKQVNSRVLVRTSTLQCVNKINAAHLDHLKRQLSMRERISESDDLCLVLFTLVQVLLSDPYVQAFLLWLLWLLLAALFYCLKMDLSFYRGFYMSVNVGYAIYWTQEEADDFEKAFAVLHIIVGQIVVSFALAAFSHTLTNSTKEWYSVESARAEAAADSSSSGRGLRGVRQSSSSSFRWSVSEDGSDAHEDDEEAQSGGRATLVPVKTAMLGQAAILLKQLHFFFSQHKVHVFFLLYLVFGVVWSWLSVGWPLEQGLYFAVSSLSTGGMWGIPEDSNDFQFFVVAVFTCTGAPIMCLSAGVFAHRLCSIGEAARALQVASAAITLEELGMMNQLDIDDGDGFIDETEYIILVLVRMKAIRPELIAAILARFRLLDAGGLGAVPYEIFQLPSSPGKKGDSGGKAKRWDVDTGEVDTSNATRHNTAVDVGDDDSGLIRVG